MFDSLFGRGELREEIEELEAELETLREEREGLEERLGAESDRRTEAVRERQAAEERANRLEDRIAQLEGEVERLDDDREAVDYRGRASIRGDRTAEVLDRLASVETGPEGALTAAVEDEVPDEVRAAFGDRAGLVARAAPCVAVTDDAGLVSVALSPPLQPDPSVEWADGFALDRSRFLPTGRFALALVRSDTFALGEYDGDERLELRGFESRVDSTHSKGGFSQGRFERRRDAQVEEHVEQCRDELEDRDADRLYVVGDREAIGELDDLADATATVAATGDAEEAIDAAFREFWTTRLYRI